MDLRQLFHRKTLYLMIVAMSAMTLSMLFLSDPSTLSISSVLGVMNGVSMENFMTAASGLGLVYTLMCIMLSFFVCDDFSSGFAQNVFTVHAGKFDYISSKIASMMVGSAVLMLLSLVESLAYCAISGVAIGSVGGIVVFWLEKWLLTAPFAAAILFLSLWMRNKGLGFLFACLLGTGGLVMGLAWAFEMLHVPFASRKYTQPDKLTAAMLREFVEKIVVHAPDKSSGHRVQRIDVHYNFIGEIDLSPEYAQKTTA